MDNNIEIMKRNYELTSQSLQRRLAYFENLYSLTNHSKKKAKQLVEIKFVKDIILLADEEADEYGWR